MDYKVREQVFKRVRNKNDRVDMGARQGTEGMVRFGTEEGGWCVCSFL